MLLAKLCQSDCTKIQKITRYIILSCHFYFLVSCMSVLYFVGLKKNQVYNHPAFTCSIPTMKIPLQFVKPVETWQYRHQKDVIDVVVESLLLYLNKLSQIILVFPLLALNNYMKAK